MIFSSSNPSSFLLGYIGVLSFVLISCQKKENENTIISFQYLSEQTTGIGFSNDIPDSDSLNILTYEYMYNGGGVAIADFDNDGLSDVFFTGNLVTNRLYHNKGNLLFEDISNSSKIGAQSFWCHGVNIVDINQDGYSDIYVNTSKSKDPELRKNLLFINQFAHTGQIEFVEKSQEYGLSKPCYSLNSSFFDYDNDQDLDLIVITNRISESRNPSQYTKAKREQFSRDRVDILYQNDWSEELGHPIFKDVSLQAGITHPGYSLGVNICDINEDGWKDIYISNDFLSNDILYINNQDGTFTNRANAYFKHTSQTAMGNDIADINNDGLMDILAVDMLPHDNERKKKLIGPTNYTSYIYNNAFGYMQQYTRNTLQLNQGRTSDSEIPIFSEQAMQSGLEATDWSWAPLIMDFDRDGLKDVYITNGFPKDITDRDFGDYNANYRAYVNREKMLELIPEVKISNYMYHNIGNALFEDVTKAWSISKPSFSNGAAYGDLDNDGDLDIIVNNINQSAFVIENKATRGHYLRVALSGLPPNRQAIGTRIHYQTDKIKSVIDHNPYRGYLSTVEDIAFIGLGQDSLVNLIVEWPDGRISTLNDIEADQLITVHQQEAIRLNKNPAHSLPKEHLLTSKSLGIDQIFEDQDFPDFNYEPLLLHKFSQYGPGLAVSDVNSDGLEDMYVTGSSAHKGQLFLQQSTGEFELSQKLLPTDRTREELAPLFFDIDSDGDEDLYIGCGSAQFEAGNELYRDILLINNNGVFSEASPLLELPKSSTTCVKAADYDQDGDLDLFVGGRVIPWQYPIAASSILLRNDSEDGQIKLTNVTRQDAPMLDSLGLVSDALWTDANQDGVVDLLIVGEWMSPTLLTNVGGKFSVAKTGLEKRKGWWNSISSADFDHDGDIDYILGNQGINTFLRASPSHPIELYASDFDGNHRIDAIPFIYFPDNKGTLRKVSFHGRDDLAKQMVRIRRQFNSNQEFANINIDSILTPEEQARAHHLTVTTLETSYMSNQGNGTFELISLPSEAQVAPVYGSITGDFNEDSHVDILLVGNDYGAHPFIGHMDAFNGLMLTGDGAGAFEPVTLQGSGFYVGGDAKALVRTFDTNGQSTLIASQNNDKLKAHVDATEARLFVPESDDFILNFRDTNGELISRKELYYGHSFLSQSSRKVHIPASAAEVLIQKYNGNHRTIDLR